MFLLGMWVGGSHPPPVGGRLDLGRMCNQFQENQTEISERGGVVIGSVYLVISYFILQMMG